MIALITIPFFLASMVLDMLARKRNDDAMAAIFQPLTTFIVIVAALLSLFFGRLEGVVYLRNGDRSDHFLRGGHDPDRQD